MSGRVSSPGLQKWLDTQPAIRSMFQDLSNQLRRRKIRGPKQCAQATLVFLKKMLGTCRRWKNTQDMINHIHAVGAALESARPMELAVGNMVRQVLYFLRSHFKAAREQAKAGGNNGDAKGGQGNGAGAKQPLAESQEDDGEDDGDNDDNDARVSSGTVTAAADDRASSSLPMQPSLSGVLAATSADGSAADYTLPVDKTFLISNVMGEMADLLEELGASQDSCSEQAEDHIAEGAKILTLGKSRSIEAFFREAHAKGRRFQVLVCESAPFYEGTEMAKCLTAAGIDATLVTDASVFAVMPKVDKVFLPTHAVMADGGLLAPTGSSSVALAAAHHAVPVVCVTGLFKLCPLYPHDLDSLNELASPEEVLDYASAQAIAGDRAEVTDPLAGTCVFSKKVLNPEYDFVPPDLIGLYVTNTGGHQPSYVYRLLAEAYHAGDRTLNAKALD